MPTAAMPADLLEDLHAARASSDPQHLVGTLQRWQLQPLTGGRNNHVYAWTDPHQGPTCIKIYYKIDDRRRAVREWAALTLLADHDIDDVPRPLWLYQDGPDPVIGMTMLDGEPLPDAVDRLAALKGMAQTTRRIQAVPLTGVLATLNRIDSIGHYRDRLTDIWPDQLNDCADEPLTADMQRLLAAWHASSDSAVLRQTNGPVFSRGDANLLNWLVTPSGAGCVDFEFAGRSTVAVDAADQIEHISARDIDDTTWHNLLADLGVDHTNRAEFAAAQRTCALRWLAVLWKQRTTRIEEFERQYQRVRTLQAPDSAWRA